MSEPLVLPRQMRLFDGAKRDLRRASEIPARALQAQNSDVLLEYVAPTKIKPGFTTPVSLSKARNDDHLMARPKRIQFHVSLHGGERKYGLSIGEAPRRENCLHVVDVSATFDVCQDCKSALDWKGEEGKWICKNEHKCGSNSSTMGKGRWSCNHCISDFCIKCSKKENSSVGDWNKARN